MIHGFPFSARIWEAQDDALAREFCVVRPDLRGAGKSSESPGPYLMERLASDVAQVLDALGIERAALAGHSMGGYVAMAFARMFTERVSRLALVASRLRADSAQEAAARWELADRIERENCNEPVVQAFVPRQLSPETRAHRPAVVDLVFAIARQAGVTGAAALLRGMALRAPGDDIAEDLDVPALVLRGAEDQIVGKDEASAMAAAFPRGRLVACEQSAHLPMMEEPDCVSQALVHWLKEGVI